MAILRWLPWVRSYCEKQKRIKALRTECVERGVAREIQRVNILRVELFWHVLDCMACREWRAFNGAYSHQRKEELNAASLALNLNTLQIAVKGIAVHRTYLQNHFNNVNDEKELEKELEHPTFGEIFVKFHL